MLMYKYINIYLLEQHLLLKRHLLLEQQLFIRAIIVSTMVTKDIYGHSICIYAHIYI